MNKRILEFLQDSSKQLSSKRLKGLSSGFIFDLLNIIGSLTFLIQGKNDDFVNLLWMYGGYSLTLLGIGIFENSKKKNKN